MAVAANKRSIMTLFSDTIDIYSHQVRIVLAEKGVGVEISYTDPSNLSEDLLELNPYGTVPTLVDRELVLYKSHIIMEYLDERFPHPPLCSVDPVTRARFRTIIQRIDDDWYPLVAEIESGNDKKAAKARKLLKERLLSVAPAFAAQPYFMSEEFTLVDCALAPLLWRLSLLGIEIPKQADSIRAYAKRLFERESFKESLSEEEKYFNSKDVRLRG